MAPLWNHGTIAPKALLNKKKENIGKEQKTTLSFEGVVRVYGAGAHAETIGNVCSFAHAKYAANPCPERLLRDQITIFIFVATIILGPSALRAPHDGGHRSATLMLQHEGFTSPSSLRL